jgi:2-methylcitrate dehydratase PrpD
LTTHPLVLELTGKREPRTGLEAKFSVFHSAACALVRGDGTPTAFTDEAAADPVLVDLRRRVHATTDTSIHEDQVNIVLTLKDGTKIEKRVEHAIGSVSRPLSDAQIETKFRVQSSLVIGEKRSDELMALAWRLPELARASDVVAASVPAKT